MNELESLSKIGFKFQKRFGQNFITDPNLLNAIVSDADVTDADTVVEIGAGAGTLTKALIKKAGKVIAYEIDTNLAPVLDAIKSPNLEIRYKDILKEDKEFFESLGSFKVVANLPYYITTPVIFYFLDMIDTWTKGLISLTIMVQKEVAERFTALPGSPSYGAVTAQLSVYGNAKITRMVNRRLFTPSPEVDSAVVNLKIDIRPEIKDLAFLKKVIASSFAMRRKTLVNNLTAAFGLKKEQAVEILKSLSMAENIRGETLFLEDFIKLADKIRGIL